MTTRQKILNTGKRLIFDNGVRRLCCCDDTGEDPDDIGDNPAPPDEWCREDLYCQENLVAVITGATVKFKCGCFRTGVFICDYSNTCCDPTEFFVDYGARFVNQSHGLVFDSFLGLWFKSDNFSVDLMDEDWPTANLNCDGSGTTYDCADAYDQQGAHPREFATTVSISCLLSDLNGNGNYYLRWSVSVTISSTEFSMISPQIPSTSIRSMGFQFLSNAIQADDWCPKNYHYTLVNSFVSITSDEDDICWDEVLSQILTWFEFDVSGVNLVVQ